MYQSTHCDTRCHQMHYIDPIDSFDCNSLQADAYAETELRLPYTLCTLLVHLSRSIDYMEYNWYWTARLASL